MGLPFAGGLARPDASRLGLPRVGRVGLGAEVPVQRGAARGLDLAQQPLVT